MCGHAEKLNWGIIGTGTISGVFARGLSLSRYGKLVSAAARSRESASGFRRRFGVPRVCDSFEEVLNDENIHAVYIAVPHPAHDEWAVKAAEAGKHVLCEKPAAMDKPRAKAMLESARDNRVFFMEGFMYRCHPQTKILVELLRNGEIGEVNLLRAAFSFKAARAPQRRLLNKAAGGGSILDLGGYPVSLARLVAGAASGKDFMEPAAIHCAGYIGETGVDEYASAILSFPGRFTAQIFCGFRFRMEKSAGIYGSEGTIVIPNPWADNRENPENGKIIIIKNGGETVIDIPAENTSFGYEADAVAEAVFAGKAQAEYPAMSWGDTLGNMAALDECRKDAGMFYGGEAPA